jgi:glycosyltransferase involved in cell wall biosynthesis
MMKTLRVLQVLPKLELGGVERATLDTVSQLRKVSPVAYVACEHGSLLEELTSCGGTHLDLRMASKNPFQIILNARKLVHLIKKHNINLIHARSRAPAWSALLASKLTKVPLITTYHGAYSASNRLKKFYNSVMVKGDLVIVHTEFMVDHIQSHYPDLFNKIRLVRGGIDIEAFDPKNLVPEQTVALRKEWHIPSDGILFALPGRMSRRKGHLVFVEAIRHLNHPKVWGIIIGENNDSAAYSKEVALCAKGLQIRQIPARYNLQATYRAADFILCPSVVPETFGRVVAEAGAMERIVIASKQGALPEVCLDGQTGFLFPPNDPQALAMAMRNAVNLSPSERLLMEKAAREHVAQNFSLERMGLETLALYHELIA